MIGSVWEWTTDWYAPKHPAGVQKPCCILLHTATRSRSELGAAIRAFAEA
jgi:formylglycine-generating enzyme required for sulfatase activity